PLRSSSCPTPNGAGRAGKVQPRGSGGATRPGTTLVVADHQQLLVLTMHDDGFGTEAPVVMHHQLQQVTPEQRRLQLGRLVVYPQLPGQLLDRKSTRLNS